MLVAGNGTLKLTPHCACRVLYTASSPTAAPLGSVKFPYVFRLGTGLAPGCPLGLKNDYS